MQRYPPTYFCIPDGWLAEWLGSGLQNLLQRFESATNLYQLARLAIAMPGLFGFLISRKYSFSDLEKGRTFARL